MRSRKSVSRKLPIEMLEDRIALSGTGVRGVAAVVSNLDARRGPGDALGRVPDQARTNLAQQAVVGQGAAVRPDRAALRDQMRAQARVRKAAANLDRAAKGLDRALAAVERSGGGQSARKALDRALADVKKSTAGLDRALEGATVGNKPVVIKAAQSALARASGALDRAEGRVPADRLSAIEATVDEVAAEVIAGSSPVTPPIGAPGGGGVGAPGGGIGAPVTPPIGAPVTPPIGAPGGGAPGGGGVGAPGGGVGAPVTPPIGAPGGGAPGGRP